MITVKPVKEQPSISWVSDDGCWKFAKSLLWRSEQKVSRSIKRGATHQEATDGDGYHRPQPKVG